MDARVVNVVRSSGCFLRVGSVGELVDALRDRCVAEGREFVATYVTRHWDEVSREVRAREGERTVTSGRRAREEGREVAVRGARASAVGVEGTVKAR